jgi:hypothetical protein
LFNRPLPYGFGSDIFVFVKDVTHSGHFIESLDASAFFLVQMILFLTFFQFVQDSALFDGFGEGTAFLGQTGFQKPQAGLGLQ